DSSQIYFGYGPTEGTILCATYTVPGDRSVQKHIIGTPMNNMAVLIYDRYQKLVPIGVPGELYIGGASVARGYWRREGLTQERFVVIDGQRWYRTVDRARYLVDVTL